MSETAIVELRKETTAATTTDSRGDEDGSSSPGFNTIKKRFENGRLPLKQVFAGTDGGCTGAQTGSAAGSNNVRVDGIAPALVTAVVVTSPTAAGRPTKALPGAPKKTRSALPSIPVQETQAENISNCPWYYADVDRETVNTLLQRMNQNGAFVVRRSGTGGEDSPYVLCVYHDGDVSNIKIGRRTGDQFGLGTEKSNEKKFDTVPELIDYFRSFPVDVYKCGHVTSSVKLTIHPRR